MKKTILTLLLCSLVVPSAHGSSASLMIEARNQQLLTRAENLNTNCRYVDLIRPEISEAARKLNFAQPSPQICATSEVAYASLQKYFGQRPRPQIAFPLYSDVLERARAPIAAKLKARNLIFPVHAPAGRKSVGDVRLDPWETENNLRKILGVTLHATRSPLPPAGNCNADISQDISDLKGDPYNQIRWHALLLEKGYDCTAAAFSGLNASLNSERNYKAIQTNFAKNIQDFSKKPFAEIAPLLKGRTILYFPHLGYDIPHPPWVKSGEQLRPNEAKKAFEKMGARVYVIERVTTSHRDIQIEDSWRHVQKILEIEAKKQKTANPKFLVFARSMGGMIAREVMMRHPELEKNVSTAILIGTTPWGSAIADYKFRADLFDDTFLRLNSAFFKALGTVGGVINKKLGRFQKESGRRVNFWSMSHFSFTPTLTDLNIPVLNVTALPASIRNYYNGSVKTPPVDLTFTHMAMYGPTEGSAPLAHAAWDTHRSARVVDGRLNHLAYWELSDQEGLSLWAASIFTAHQAGMFR